MSTWEEKAFNTHKLYYTHFGGCQWSEFDIPGSRRLLRAKICYALFGSPKKNEDNIEDLYEPEQQKRAEEIIDKLLTLLPSNATKIKVGFLFIACKQKKEEFTIPIFRVLNENEHGAYVDTHCRTYSNWDDWKCNNTLPMMKYCYPKSGYYTCKDGECAFDENRDPIVEFGETPSSNVSSQIFRYTDTASGIISLASAGVAIVGMFTPLAPAVLLGSMIAGTSSATYGATRVCYRLYDKGTHGESLADLESAVLWFSLAATPLNFATSAMNGVLRGAAVNGRILTNSVRTFATILNFTTLGVDSVMIGFGIFNLIEKGRNNQLSALDIAQFSMSVFFFTNTLIQPKVASQIIAQAQDQHINQYLTSMSDEQAKISLEKFVKDNQASNTITDKSKIIRTINRIDDPTTFFKNVGNAEKVMIGGRKGRTVLVTDANGNTNRINPNRVMYFSDTQGTTNFNKTYNGLTKCFNKDLKDVKLKGKKIFNKMSEREKAVLKQAYEATARKNEDVIQTAYKVAEALDCQTPDEFASVIEIVAAEVKGLDASDKLAKLNNIQGVDKDNFIDGIKRDQMKVQEIGKQKDLKFSDDLKAVYHYRKHGTDFPTKSVCNIEFYLDSVPERLIKDAHLTEIKNLPDGTVRKFYRTQNDSFAVVTERPGQRTISSIYKKPGTYNDFMQKLKDYYSNIENPNVKIREIQEYLTIKEGFLATNIYLGVQTRKPQLLEHCTNLDPKELEEIARQLSCLAA